MMTINNLVAHTIPLKGKHLIEASAGTGKTFNITRIYLRLLCIYICYVFYTFYMAHMG